MSRSRSLLDAVTWQVLDSQIIEADCLEAMREMPACCVDAVVTDPPYGIGFMGHEWDQPGKYGPVSSGHGGCNVSFGGKPHPAMEAGRYDLSATANRRFQQWCEAWARECLRVLKPGGHMLVFGGTRTSHRMAAGIEDAGFEIRDTLMWMFGSGFPKSHDVAKAIDTAEAQEWQGWGTALKPGWEPIVMARKPLEGTVAANVLAHGVGVLNIGGCRVGHAGRWPANVALSHTESCVMVGERQAHSNGHFPGARGPSGYGAAVAGSNGGGLKGQDGLHERRFDGETVAVWECSSDCPVAILDEATGELTSGFMAAGTRRDGVGYGGGLGGQVSHDTIGDSGGASRFFYCAKTSRNERDAGLDQFHVEPLHWSSGDENPGSFQSEGTVKAARNSHPTVKPIELMRWLLRLVTPPGGLVLDPFAGSASTVCAGEVEGITVVGIEREPAYVAIARARALWWGSHPAGVEPGKRLTGSGRRERLAGQMDFLTALAEASGEAA